MRADLIDVMGSDLTVANAARVSFNKESDWDWDQPRHKNDKPPLKEGDVKLIKYLASHGHWTPFAHPQITLRMKAPIFVRTQCFKHKQGFVENEVSRRYVDDEPEFYFPILRQRPDDGMKQGSKNEFPPELETCEFLIQQAYKHAEVVYKALLVRNVAPEQARMILPQSMYTEWYWTGSLAAYARFCEQRMDEHAQKEIQDLAKMVSDLIQPLFPVSWAALTT